ncbi:MAG TPA: LptA/OstA family protein, partial [Blastocatellia bacterium]
MGRLHLQSDTLTYNSTTGDLVAEGNVIYDQGNSQRITAQRAEINNLTHRGTFWETTGFTNRTETGEYLFFTAERVVKTGPDTYELYNATVTACEDTTPKWSFTSKRADLRLDDKVKLYDAVFRVRGFPAFIFPVMWLPTTKEERKSGFLIPVPGNSNQKGRTLQESYFQTLGKSADITLSSYYYSARGLGAGAFFRVQTADNSFFRFSVFDVKDRLFGVPESRANPNEGGTSFNGYGVQYLPGGWLAAGQLSVTSSLAFRQVFSDSLAQVINPTQETIGYLTKDAQGYSINFMAENETTTIYDPSQLHAARGNDFDISLRHLPEADITGFDRAILPNWPIYFSFDSAFGATSRVEALDGIASFDHTPVDIKNTDVFNSPTVGRFDVAPKITAPLPSFAGIEITPSLTLRDTYYTASQNPAGQVFNPDYEAVPGSPALVPGQPGFVPALKEFDFATTDRILSQGLDRHYAELNVDIRLPAFEKRYHEDDASRTFKHVIEPYLNYTLISGISGTFNNIILLDERDAVADANMVEFGVVNRFYLLRRPVDIIRRHARLHTWHLLGMQPEKPRKSNRAADTDITNISCEECAPESSSPQGQEPETTEGSAEAESNVAPQRQLQQPANQSTEPASQAQASPIPVPQTPASGAQATQPSGTQASNAQPSPTQPTQGKGSQPSGQSTGAGQKAQRQSVAGQGLETGESVPLLTDVLGPYINSRSVNARPTRKFKLVEGLDEDDTTDEDEPVEPYEFLTVKVAGDYFIDRTFGGALGPNSVMGPFFYPLNTLSGFTFGGVPRAFSPLNID